jgi:FAD/FMN-containing dehydrogenase
VTPLDGLDLVRTLSEIVGTGHVLTDPDLRRGYESDWTGRFGAPSSLVVRPGDPQQVAAVLAACNTAGMPVVPQGGNTGLVGGGVPAGGEVLLSLSRLTEVGAVDVTAGQLLVGAGVTLARAQAAASAAGWELALDIGARDSATVGGLVATDAGGAMALRYGTMRAQVAGLEVALADGRLLGRLGGLLKDNAGFAWPSLIVGSEGTLGVVTRVLLRLRPPKPCRVAALFAVDDAAAAVALLAQLRAQAPSLEAADFFFDEGVELVAATMPRVRLALRERAPCYVIAQCAATRDPMEELVAAAEHAGKAIRDVAVADDGAGRRELWRIREAQPEALVLSGAPIKIDVGVPLPAIPAFVSSVRELVEHTRPSAKTILWGHLGDGNVHVNVVGTDPHDADLEDAVLRLAAGVGGTISAEHGIGRAKAKLLGLVRTDAEILAMRQIKSALDPCGVLNPGCVLAII